MVGERAALRFLLLDVPILVRSNRADLLERLAICYQGLATHERSDALEVDIEATGDWRVRVRGRAERRAADFAEAVRAVNHELMHGIMLARSDNFYVHAGVAAVDGSAVVLPGLSRAGKSTLVLALVEAGAQLLSDELLVFDPDERAALAFPRAIKVRDECVAYFPRYATGFVGRGEGRFLPCPALGRDRISRRAVPRLVVVPRYARKTSLAPIARGQALIALTESALNFGSHQERSIDHLADLVSAADCFSLEWNDPHPAAALVLTALGGKSS